MAAVLAVGVATLDWIQLVERYPEPDTEIRAQQQYLWRGGNATNTLAVLNQLGHGCSWLGTLADDSFAEVICADLDKNQIDYSFCPRVNHSVSPTSHILLSQQTSSRNIVHYRSLRELNSTDYAKIDFSQWDWIHFEGRNVEETLALLRHLKSQHPTITLSLEIEKPRNHIEQLFEYSDHCLFSRHYVHSQGYDLAEKFLRDMAAKTNNDQKLICAWGEKGAMLLTNEDKYIEVPAQKIDVIDTRAAGDVFNAAYINACLNGEELLQSVEQACDLAARKCAQLGLDNLSN